MKKIKFTSKKCSRPSAIQRAALMKPLTLIYFEEESVASVSGSDEIILYCKSKNILLRLKEPSTHREAVDWVKAHAQQLWDKYDFAVKFKEDNTMISPVTINKTTIKNGAGEPSTNYAQIIYKDIEVGFINDEGVYLKMYNPGCKFGVFKKLNVWKDKTFSQRCTLFNQNWEAIYDRYDTIVRGK